MSQTRPRVVTYLFIFLFCWTTLASAEMMYNSSHRNIYGYGVQLEHKEEASMTLGAFEAAMLHSNYLRDADNQIIGHENASVSQNSTLSENLIRGFGRGSGFGSGGGIGVGGSTMMVEFDVDQAMRFTLTGQLRLAPHGDGIGLNGSHAVIRLTGPDGPVMEVVMDEDNLPDTVGAIDFSGENRLSDIYPAGSYKLEAIAEGHGNDGKTRCVDFDFTLTALNAIAVPEPSTSLLALFSVLGLLVCRRRIF